MSERSIFLQKILNINLDIKTNWFSKSFSDSDLEKLFINFIATLTSKNIIYVFVVLKFIYIYLLIECLITNSHRILYFLVFMLTIDIFFIISLYKTKNKRLKKIILYLKYFHVIISLNVFIIFYIYNNLEILPMINLLIILKSLLYILILDSSIILSVILSLLCTLIISIGLIISNKKTFQFMNEILIEIVVVILSNCIKYSNEDIIRNLFLSKFKYEKFYNHCSNNLDNSNSLNFFIYENKNFFIEKNTKDFLEKNYLFKNKINKNIIDENSKFIKTEQNSINFKKIGKIFFLFFKFKFFIN